MMLMGACYFFGNGFIYEYSFMTNEPLNRSDLFAKNSFPFEFNYWNIDIRPLTMLSDFVIYLVMIHRLVYAKVSL